MRIFVDTNIIISSMLFPNGKVAAVFNHIMKNHDVIFSDYTIAECKKVIELKFPDKKDLPVLAAAMLSDADILLTGDKDFCDINLEKPLIFTPSEYFDLI